MAAEKFFGSKLSEAGLVSPTRFDKGVDAVKSDLDKPNQAETEVYSVVEKAITDTVAVITALEKWIKSDNITQADQDSAVLAIGKLKGAVVKLNRE